MAYKNIRYKILSVLVVLATLASCVDDDYLCPDDDFNGVPEDIRNGYSLTLTLTLDKMGGDNGTTRAPGSLGYTPKEMEEIENYVNQEKVRVLFFDDQERFLFESKSRWIKKLELNKTTGEEGSETKDHSTWLVSIPVFSYGNDESYNWNWEKIREALTSADFKIVILANRPEKEVLPELEDNIYGGNKDFDNRGPRWTVNDTRWPEDWEEGTNENANVKHLFDLHHCQRDPIYENKSRPSESSGSVIWNGEDFYGFVMGGTDKGDRTMSATSSWVDWGPNLDDTNNKHEKWTSRRLWRRPSQDYPIPMYGVQNFEKIENWTKGTPFNLSYIASGQKEGREYKSISLLRSVVRLELLIPKSIDNPPKNVALFYTNIYARCEPMDIWTPTEDLWKEEHAPDVSKQKCDWYLIRNYGRITQHGDPTGTINSGAASFEAFRDRISWFYGAWLEKGWNFGTFGKDKVQAKVDENGGQFPRIFNPCTQRNQKVFCDNVDYSDYYKDDYYHYVVYTGERNLNDPNRLYNLGSVNSMDGTVCYWWFNIDNKAYSLPLTDYTSDFSGLSHVLTSFTYDQSKEPDNTAGINSYAEAVQGGKDGNITVTTKDLPWPLVRNHVYRIIVDYVRGKEPTKPIVEDREWGFSLTGGTIANLNADSNWGYSNATPIINNLSWNTAPTLTNKTTDEMEYKGTSRNLATWSGNYSLMINRSDKEYVAGSNITIDGSSYKTIRLSNFAQNVLTLPPGKVCRKMTLYSYINKKKSEFDAGVRPCFWEEVGGVHYMEENAKQLKCCSDGDLTNPDKCEYTFEKGKNVITFTNSGEQLYFVVVLEVEDELPYWQLKNPVGVLSANGVKIEELRDLKFANADAINIYEKEPYKIRLTGAATITFPKMVNGTKVSITGQSANHDVSDRGIQPVQNYLKPAGEGTVDGVNNFIGKRVAGAINEGVYTFTWQVNTTDSNPVDVEFKLVNGGIDFYEFKVDVSGVPSSSRSASANDDQPPLVVRSENLYSKTIDFNKAKIEKKTSGEKPLKKK